jgi:hypothetical protein
VVFLNLHSIYCSHEFGFKRQKHHIFILGEKDVTHKITAYLDVS